ncbi:MAG TPA: YfiR family protein [Gemmatimonadaceae bacterium]|jgi:hypothetical protein|nr:YfiR family protein [Gemmatimonadaceae bacterium]
MVTSVRWAQIPCLRRAGYGSAPEGERLGSTPFRRRHGICARAIVQQLAIALLAATAALAPRTTEAQAQPAIQEYQLKAVFLFNFAQFVDWPAGSAADSSAPLVIGVLGDDPFGSQLDDVVHGETIHSHPLIVQRYRRLEDVTHCHILFISQSERDRMPQIMTGLKGKHILTVGDTEHFAQDGGMIQFVTEHHKIRLRIDLEAAKADDLTISSKLLRPAEIVSPRGG